MDKLPFGKLNQLSRPPRKENKYRAVKAKSVFTGRMYDSKAERDFRNWLFAREENGELHSVQEQIGVDLGSDITWKCDFLYYEIKTERWLYAEVKGVETERFRMVKKLWRHNGPGLLQIWKRRNASSAFRVTQEIMPLV